jgi:hypothetical protein
MIQLNPAVETELEDLQRVSFSYFEHEVNPENGLAAAPVADHQGLHVRNLERTFQ